MDREQYFASKLEAGQYLTQTELEELIYSFDIDNIKTADNMVPIRFNGRVWLVGFNPDPLWLFQPVEAEEYDPNEWYPIILPEEYDPNEWYPIILPEEYDPNEWYPIILPEELSKKYQEELLVQEILAQDSELIEVNPECIEAL